jgi:hypothetical protein
VERRGNYFKPISQRSIFGKILYYTAHVYQTRRTMNLYDLYLSSGCRTYPYLSDLAVSVNVLLDLDLNKLIQSEQFIPGFLGLELPTNTAACFLERLKEAGGGGTIVPSAYRQPRVSIEMAYPIAFQAIIQKQNTPSPP